MKKAFTLAEVLITLGIIGVVAAMTIPALITNYQKKVTATRVKKAYAELLQAIKLSEAENETIESWDRGTDRSIENTRRFIEKYIMPYYKGLTLCSEGVTYKCGYPVSYDGANYLTLNGTQISFVVSQTEILYVIIDINGKEKPNILGNDSFYFEINEVDSKYELRPSGWHNGITKEKIKEGFKDNKGYIYTCKKIQNKENPNELHRHGCTAWLMIDNWEFKNDYPW